MKVAKETIVFFSLLFLVEGFLGRGSRSPSQGDVFEIYCNDFDSTRTEVSHHSGITRRGIEEATLRVLQDLESDIEIRNISELVSSLQHHQATEDIVEAAVSTHVGQKASDPRYHFMNEGFNESQALLTELWERLVAEGVSEERGNISELRSLLGTCLALVQDFYSHSNWIEIGREDILRGLGTPGFVFEEAAQRDVSTCNPCPSTTSSDGGDEDAQCEDNLRAAKEQEEQRPALTSSYWPEAMGDGVTIPEGVEKCVEETGHGNLLRIRGNGGIGKDLPTSCYSAHSSRHQEAATLATKATIHYLIQLSSELGSGNFLGLLGMSPRTSMTVVADSRGLTKEESAAIFQLQRPQVPTKDDRKEKNATAEEEINVFLLQTSGGDSTSPGDDDGASGGSGHLIREKESDHQDIFSALADALEKASPNSATFFIPAFLEPGEGSFLRARRIALHKNIRIFVLYEKSGEADAEHQRSPENELKEGSMVKMLAALSVLTGGFLIPAVDLHFALGSPLSFPTQGSTTIIKRVEDEEGEAALRFQVDELMDSLHLLLIGRMEKVILTSPQGMVLELEENPKVFVNRGRSKDNATDVLEIQLWLHQEEIDVFGTWKIEVDPISKYSLLISAASKVQWIPVFYSKYWSRSGPTLIRRDQVSTTVAGKPDFLSIQIIPDGILQGTPVERLESLETLFFVECLRPDHILLTLNVTGHQMDQEDYLSLPPDRFPSIPFAIAMDAWRTSGGLIHRIHPTCFQFEVTEPRFDTEVVHWGLEARNANPVMAGKDPSPEQNKKRLDASFKADKSGKLLTDTVPPELRLVSKSSCSGFLKRKDCEDRTWTARIDIYDLGLGLQSVRTDPVSSVPFFPPGVPRIQFTYSNDCCEPEVEIFATDVAANSNSIHISVGELSPALPVWLIIVIAVSCLFLLILLIVLVACCVRGRRSKRRDSVTLTRSR